jgi:probable phosphoglycerate mutase
MQSTHIIAIRHGETDWNVLGRYQGQTDIPLNESGLAQARQVASFLRDKTIHAIYTSNLSRASQTALEIAQVRKGELRIIPELREQHYGVFQGLTGAQVKERWPDSYQKWHDRVPEFGPEGGETRNEFKERCIKALQQVAVQHPGEVLAVVCHGGVLDCLYREAAKLPMDAARTWSLENAAMNHLRYDESGFSLVDWGNVSHLDQAGRDEMKECFPGP